MSTIGWIIVAVVVIVVLAAVAVGWRSRRRSRLGERAVAEFFRRTSRPPRLLSKFNRVEAVLWRRSSALSKADQQFPHPKIVIGQASAAAGTRISLY